MSASVESRTGVVDDLVTFARLNGDGWRGADGPHTAAISKGEEEEVVEDGEGRGEASSTLRGRLWDE